MNTMTIPALIDTLSHSGLHTVNAIRGGYETPLINEYKLRPFIEAINGFEGEALKALVAARHRAIEASKKTKVVGYTTIMGFKAPIVEITHA